MYIKCLDIHLYIYIHMCVCVFVPFFKRLVMKDHVIKLICNEGAQ